MGKPLRIGLLGLGNVGAGVLRLLTRNRELVENKAKAPLEVARVLVRDLNKSRNLDLPSGLLTTDPGSVLADPEIDLVIEVLGGLEPARAYLVQALQAGKYVITANKDVVAAYGEELFAAAAAGGAELYFEAGVAGGIPIIRPLKESLAGNRIEAVMGIVNGTTNYILSSMTADGLDFETALAGAQALGYAEPDPKNDIEGLDAARKLAILASIGFLRRVTPDGVFTEGISRVTARDIEYGRRLGWVIKLLAIGKQNAEGIEVRVHPTFISRRHPLAAVDGALNAIFVTGDAVGETMFYGRGAGAEPTASSIVGDVVAAARSLQARRLAMHRGLNDELGDPDGWTGGALQCTCQGMGRLLPMDAVRTRYYLRFDVQDQPGVLARVAGAFGAAGVSIAHILQTPNEEQGTAEIVVVTHVVAEGLVRKALAGLEQVPELRAVANLIRIEL